MMQEPRHCPLPDRILIGNILNELKQAVLVYTEAALHAETSASRRMFQQLAQDAMMKYEQLDAMADQHRLSGADAAPVSRPRVQQVARLAAETASNLRQLVNARLTSRQIPYYIHADAAKPPEFMLPREAPFTASTVPLEPNTKQEEAAEKKTEQKRGRKAKAAASAAEAPTNSESQL